MEEVGRICIILRYKNIHTFSKVPFLSVFFFKLIFICLFIFFLVVGDGVIQVTPKLILKQYLGENFCMGSLGCHDGGLQSISAASF